MPSGFRAGRRDLWLQAVLVLPMLWGLWLVCAFGVNVVFNDEWSMVPLFRAVIEGRAGWMELWQQSNEHRIFFPRLVLLGTAWLTDYDTKVQMLVSQLWVLGVYGACLNQVRTMSGLRPPLRAGVGLLAGFVCYNTMQYENFLWGFQMVFLMVLCFAVWGFYCMHQAVQSGRKGWIAAALAAGTVASFSSLQGLLVWPAYVAMLLAVSLESPRFGLRCAVLAGGFGLLIWAVYFTGYQKPDWSPEYLGRGVGYAVGYFLASVGGFSAARYAGFAVGMGLLAVLLGLGLAVDLASRQRIRANVFGIGLIFFSYAFSGALAIGRVNESGGMAHAMTSRYSTFGLLNYLGMFLIMVRERHAWGGAGWRRAGVVLLACFSGIVLGKCLLYVYPSRKWREERSAEVAVIRHYREATPEQLGQLKPFRDGDRARRYIEQLERAGWNVFEEGRGGGLSR